VITVAYLANCFPVPVEPYVGDEIDKLRKRGVRVVAGTVRPPPAQPQAEGRGRDVLQLQPLRMWTLIRALALAIRRWRELSSLLMRVLLRGDESFLRRCKALLHTLLGSYYAVQLQEHKVDHIHVHHGYFGSWIGMVAARLLGVGYSLTLHGSDLLVHRAYLDTKLEHCRFCMTISEYNRGYIFKNFPSVKAGKVRVSRMGVEIPKEATGTRNVIRGENALRLLAVGRLHHVKDHAFLIRACAQLRDCGLGFQCAIAGDGPERDTLASLIGEKRLQDRVTLLGHVTSERMDTLYRGSDVVVLTSRSEGIPLVLMEAMARGKPVLAPSINGIPELVIQGKTGFLYRTGDAEDFVEKIFALQEMISKPDVATISRLDWIAHAARLQILHNFNRDQNLSQFCDQFLGLITAG
jgi:colanic acid/amylovoran biosynthesis glycosyltransferase